MEEIPKGQQHNLQAAGAATGWSGKQDCFCAARLVETGVAGKEADNSGAPR